MERKRASPSSVAYSPSVKKLRVEQQSSSSPTKDKRPANKISVPEIEYESDSESTKRATSAAMASEESGDRVSDGTRSVESERGSVTPPVQEEDDELKRKVRQRWSLFCWGQRSNMWVQGRAWEPNALRHWHGLYSADAQIL